jgi:hypothetical protein
VLAIPNLLVMFMFVVTILSLLAMFMFVLAIPNFACYVHVCFGHSKFCLLCSCLFWPFQICLVPNTSCFLTTIFCPLPPCSCLHWPFQFAWCPILVVFTSQIFSLFVSPLFSCMFQPF